MAFNPKFQLYSDRDMAKALEGMPRIFQEDYAQVKRGQIDTADKITEIDIRLDDAEGRLDVVELRLDVVEADIVVIKKRLDDVEAVAYMALMT
jgi:tetrahydromethanopterin S-methyltransferase subunit G